MDKIKGLSIIIVAIFSVTLTIVLANKLLDTSGKVNQGNFRVSDVVIQSSAIAKEVQGDDVDFTSMSDFLFNITQTNKISILLDSNCDASSIRIENLQISGPNEVGNLVIYQNNHNEIKYNVTITELELEKNKNEQGKYVLELNIDNKEALENQRLSNSVKEVNFDASMLQYLPINKEDLKMDVSFDIVIEDVLGKTVRTNMKYRLPTDETFSSGMSILRQDVSKNIFSFDK